MKSKEMNDNLSGLFGTSLFLMELWFFLLSTVSKLEKALIRGWDAV